MRKTVTKIMGITLFILGILLSLFLVNESVSQFINMFCIIGIGSWVLKKGLSIPEISNVVQVLGIPISSAVIKMVAKSVYAKYICKFYNWFLYIMCDLTGINKEYHISKETAVTLSFWILFLGIAYWSSMRDYTAMKIKKGSMHEEFRQRNYIEKSQNFCKLLRQKLEAVNRETDWNEHLFTPIQAEVEVCIKGKRKKKFEDLLKCLKNIRHKNAIFLVLGDPGSGKSVALRKLCLDLLDESVKTKKIPVYINLKKWNKEWNLDNLPNKKDLIDFIKTVLYEDGDFFSDNFLNDYFEKMLEEGRWYFVFDSFDEMPCLMGKDDCQELIDKISELLFDFMSGVNQTGGIIASRLYKSPSEALGATVTLKLQEFNDIKIKIMLQKYLNNAGEVVKQLFGKRESLVVLCRNPFYLTLLINFIRDKGLLFPENQMELYQSFIESRLQKCSGKIQSENMTVQEVHELAKKLAVFMQQSVIYGLECPVDGLLRGKEEYWEKGFKILEYAKICRIGGAEKTISFVHRRFQEFLLVENIMESGQMIGQKEYENIVTNSGLRDALVLYCEVTDKDNAEEIAKYCWEVVQRNKQHVNNISDKHSIELINVLYFMAQAFRNRKSALTSFEDEFAKFIKDCMNKDTDFVILCAMVNSMVLLKSNQLQKIVIKVFKLKNRWLSDIVMQNCRIIKQLNYRIERQFISYFSQMEIPTFWKRFSNIQFSLSLSRSFQYVKTVHFMIFVIEVLLAMIAIAIGAVALTHVKEYWGHIINFIHNIQHSNITFSKFWNEYIVIMEPHNTKEYVNATIIYCFATIPAIFIIRILKIVDRINIFMMLEMFCLLIVVYPYHHFGGEVLIGVLAVVIIIFCVVVAVHDICSLVKSHEIRKYRNDIIKMIKRSLIKIIPCFVIMLLAWKLAPILVLVSLIILSIMLFVIICAVIRYFYCLYKDWRWIKKQPDLRRMSRENLAKDLQKLRLEKSKLQYVDHLLLKKVDLIGEWPYKKRPECKDDRLELSLARLDCSKIVTYNYLF